MDTNNSVSNSSIVYSGGLYQNTSQFLIDLANNTLSTSATILNNDQQNLNEIETFNNNISSAPVSMQTSQELTTADALWVDTQNRTDYYDVFNGTDTFTTSPGIDPLLHRMTSDTMQHTLNNSDSTTIIASSIFSEENNQTTNLTWFEDTYTDTPVFGPLQEEQYDYYDDEYLSTDYAEYDYYDDNMTQNTSVIEFDADQTWLQHMEGLAEMDEKLDKMGSDVIHSGSAHNGEYYHVHLPDSVHHSFFKDNSMGLLVLYLWLLILIVIILIGFVAFKCQYRVSGFIQGRDVTGARGRRAESVTDEGHLLLTTTHLV